MTIVLLVVIALVLLQIQDNTARPEERGPCFERTRPEKGEYHVWLAAQRGKVRW